VNPAFPTIAAIFFDVNIKLSLYFALIKSNRVGGANPDEERGAREGNLHDDS
jgi:hypothetical protein